MMGSGVDSRGVAAAGDSRTGRTLEAMSGGVEGREGDLRILFLKTHFCGFL
jgi:hypothetical protein